MEKQLSKLIKEGREGEAKEFLQNNPTLNVNWQNQEGWTALHWACGNGGDGILLLLLAHPDIVLNLKTNGGRTPFYVACRQAHLSCVRLLLKDSRVKVNEPSSGGHTPLRSATFQGHTEVIRWWIASGREMDLGQPGNDRTDAIEIAERCQVKALAVLLRKFKENPAEARHEVRVELGCRDELAAEVFALVVFVSDGLLEVRRRTQNKKTLPNRARFFRITGLLPLELQMILCYRLVGSAKEVILGKVSEAAFRDLAQRI